jgi:choline dehydrogenase-like flavoprotein
MRMDKHDFDAIVIGSGISGGWAAKELTEQGLEVLLLERGRSITPADYVGEHKPAWQFPFRQLGDRKRYERDFPIQSTCYAFGEPTEQWWVKDSEHPYGQDPARPFRWIRGFHLGGKSLMWGRCTPRWGPVNFEENKRDGHGVDWPIRYDDVKAWYDHVEEFIGVSGQTEYDSPTAPVGKFQPGMLMNACETFVADKIREKFPDRHLTIAPSAILTKPLPGRAACHYCGPCERGCSTGSYFSSISSTLPAAKATGNLTVVTDSVVVGLDYDPKSRKVAGVRAIDQNTRAGKRYTARIVFLNASTLGSTQILLNSTSESFPHGLGNRSGVLGQYLMDHMYIDVFGVIPGLLDKYTIGNRPAGLWMPRYHNVEERTAPFLRGFSFQGGATRANWTQGVSVPGHGAALKQRLREYGPWTMDFSAFLECLPYRHNTLTLDPVRKDKWGLPLINTRFAWGKNERVIAKVMVDDATVMLKAAGATDIAQSPVELPPGGYGIHEMGTARMGRDPATSFLNGHNQSHEVANLFVTDGSCMASTAAQNPSLTYMALTARAANYAVQQMKSGAL